MSRPVPRLPSVAFVETLPTERRRPQLVSGWVAYVVAKLEERPGEWAKIDAPNANTTNVKESCERWGVNVDVVVRQGDLYMRLNL